MELTSMATWVMPLDKLSEKLMEGVAIRRGEGSGEGFIGGFTEDGANKASPISGLLPELIEIVGGGAFAVGAGYADDVELPSGMAKPRTTEVAISQAGIRNDDNGHRGRVRNRGFSTRSAAAPRA
jgi:hypothetical protein